MVDRRGRRRGAHALIAVVFAVRRESKSSTAAVQKGQLVLVLPVSGVSSGEDSWIRLGAMDYLASRLRAANGLQILPSEQTVA